MSWQPVFLVVLDRKSGFVVAEHEGREVDGGWEIKGKPAHYAQDFVHRTRELAEQRKRALEQDST